MSDEIILFTNISFVSLLEPPKFRFEACSLLIAPPDKEMSLGSSSARFRGFGCSGSDDPVFDLFTNTVEYVLDDGVKDTTKMIMSDDKPRPLFSGAVLTIDKLKFFLQAEEHSKPICVDKFTIPDINPEAENRYEGRSEVYEELWDTMRRRVLEFWHAPNIGYKRWMPVRLAALANRQ